VWARVEGRPLGQQDGVFGSSDSEGMTMGMIQNGDERSSHTNTYKSGHHGNESN